MSDLLQEAMAAKQKGDIAVAKQLLSQAIIQNPNNEDAWMLMSEVVEDVGLRRNCLEKVLAINPENTIAGIALTKLNTSPLAPVTRGERDKPLNLSNHGKTPPFTPPFTWNGKQEEYLALGEHTFPELKDEKTETAPDTIPTFDWATDSEEPDKSIQKIFDAVSKPELAAQPPQESDMSWLDRESTNDQAGSANLHENEADAKFLDEVVGSGKEKLPQPQPMSLDGFTLSGEPQPGPDTSSSKDQLTSESTEPDAQLWDNPKARLDRLIILSRKSIIYANPEPSDIPHILGLFSEKKMIRDLLGEDAGAIKLESIQRLTVNPKSATLGIGYQQNEKLINHKLAFSNRSVRDEALAALQFRLSSGFSQSIRTYPVIDKILAPILALLFVAVLGLIASLPIVISSSTFQPGTLQTILTSLEHFAEFVGVINLFLITGFCGLICLVWLVLNLMKPSKLIIFERP